MATIHEVEQRAPDCLVVDTCGITDTRDIYAAQAQFEVDLCDEGDDGAVSSAECKACRKFLDWCKEQGWTYGGGWPKDKQSEKEEKSDV